MLPSIEIVKGIHPGIILERELKTRNIKKSQIASSLNISPGIITDITKQRRGISPFLSILLGRFFNVGEDYFGLLQTYFEIKIEKSKKTKIKIEGLRPSLFWDVQYEELDYEQYESFIVIRVFERGNSEEIKKTISFYGEKKVIKILIHSKSLLFSAVENGEKYLEMNNNETKCIQSYVQRPYQKTYIQH